MRRKTLVFTLVCVFAACALAFGQQMQRTGSSKTASARSVTVGVRSTSQSSGSSGGQAAAGNLSYSVQVTDDAGNMISAPVSVVVNVPKTHESAGNKWKDASKQTPEDALPAARWGVLVPLLDDFAPAPPRSTSDLAMDRATVPASAPVLANIVYTYDTPQVSRYQEYEESYYRHLQETVTRFYSISCSEFRPLDSGQTFKCDAWELMPSNVVGINGYIAPVHLPDGAEVVELRVWVHDSDSEGDLAVLFDAVELDDVDSYYPMAELNSGGREGLQELVSYGVQYGSINNSAFKYTITVTGFSGTTHHRLLGARIQYETTMGGTPVSENALTNWR